MSPYERNRSDDCPGALKLHDAADGALARVRLPGGRLSGAQLRVLAELAAEYGEGGLDLTSRGNVQLRGLASTAAPSLAERLHRAGLLPSRAHERVRNIQASPLAGLDAGGCGGLDDLLAALDEAVCAEPRLARVSGRFLWALDDGRGDVAGAADAAWIAESPHQGRLILAGMDTGFAVPRRRAVEVLRAVTLEFLEVGSEWRLREDPGAVRRVLTSVLRDRPCLLRGSAGPLPRHGPAPLGPVRHAGGTTAVVAAVPLGRLSAAQAELLADLASNQTLVFTPWRSVVVPGEVHESLTAGGLVCTPDSPWSGVSACVGKPACAKALADVRTEAARTVGAAQGPSTMGRRAVHWSGCERRCGRPEGEHVEAVALPGGGYAVGEAGGEVLPTERAAQRLAELRENATTP